MGRACVKTQSGMVGPGTTFSRRSNCSISFWRGPPRAGSWGNCSPQVLGVGVFTRPRPEPFIRVAEIWAWRKAALWLLSGHTPYVIFSDVNSGNRPNAEFRICKQNELPVIQNTTPRTSWRRSRHGIQRPSKVTIYGDVFLQKQKERKKSVWFFSISKHLRKYFSAKILKIKFLFSSSLWTFKDSES